MTIKNNQGTRENVMMNGTKESRNVGKRICSITNAHAFPCVMGKGHEDNCRDLLQRIFPDKKIMELKVAGISGEASILNEADAKDVRLDVLFQGEKEWFDIEMQVGNTDDLRKRSRYYHSSMDMMDLEKGVEYKHLKPHYVIFICCFDLMKGGEAIYSFEHYDVKNSLPLGDGCYTIILNLKCEEGKIPKELKSFYDYANRQSVDENDEFITRLHSDLVEFSGTERGGYIMTFGEDMEIKLDYAWEEGEKQGKIEVAQNMKREGMDNDVVARLTGLSKEEILDL